MSGLEADHALLVAAVREAGAIALGFFGKDPKEWEKCPGHWVSEADLAANAHLETALLAPRPDYGWVSEESEDGAPPPVAPSTAGAPYWLVDPIDGTSAFLRGRPEFAVSVALIEAGAPVAAAVCNPATEELFDAYAGGGTRLNGKAVRTGGRAALHDARLVVSRTEYRELDWHKKLGPIEVEALSSIAYKLALVAAGRFDATATLWPKSNWDIAGGDLLVREAGGRVTDGLGRDFDYGDPARPVRSMVAAGAALHSPLLDRIMDLGQSNA